MQHAPLCGCVPRDRDGDVLQEARDKLDQLDAVTAAAQGWLRARGTHQRLAALNTFASAYPKVPQPAAGKEDSQRVKAANPLAILTQGLWQARPHEQVPYLG